MLLLSDGLSSHAIVLVGIESTGVSWRPVYTLLETAFECCLLNAQLRSTAAPRSSRVRISNSPASPPSSGEFRGEPCSTPSTAAHSDPGFLAELARGKLRKKLPVLRKALSRWFSPTHRLLIGELLAHLIDESIERLSNDIATIISPFASPSNLLETIPEVNLRTAEVINSETSADMSCYGSAGLFSVQNVPREQ
jgi:transposase